MIRIKNAVFTAVLAVFVLFAGSTYSQDLGKKTPEERAQKRADKMNEKLSLSNEQYKEIYNAFLSQAQQMEVLWSNKDMDKTTRKDQMKSIRQGTNSKISSLLTAEQLTKFEKFKEERKQKHKQKRKMKKDGSERQKKPKTKLK
jgi:periplasmic protein CpxP/Spy